MYKDIKRISGKKFSAKCELPVYIKDIDGGLEFVENLRFRFILSHDKTKNQIRLSRESKHLIWVNKTYNIKLNSIQFKSDHGSIIIDDIPSYLPNSIIITKSDSVMVRVREIRFKNLF